MCYISEIASVSIAIGVYNHKVMKSGIIRHTVAFTLRHETGSEREKAFLADGVRILSAIPGVENFECLRQVSRKNSYHWGFSMEFAGKSAYQQYNDHPDHVAFVRDRWLPEVKDFLEIDYVPSEKIRPQVRTTS